MNIQNPPGKKSVTILILLTIVTLGIYLPIWFLRRSKEFKSLQTEKQLSKTLPIIALTLQTILIIILPAFSFTKNTTIQLTGSISTITFMLAIIILHLFLAFRSRTIINQALAKKGVTRKVSGLFTFFLSIFYLQYEINRIIDNKEYEKRVGPWIWFILLIIFLLIPLIILISLSIFAQDLLQLMFQKDSVPLSNPPFQ